MPATAARRVEHFDAFDGPAMLRMWDDIKGRTGTKGTPLVADGHGYRGTLLGERNRYQVRIDDDEIDVDVTGRSEAGRPSSLTVASLDDRGIAKIIAVIRAAEVPPAPPPERAPLAEQEH